MNDFFFYVPLTNFHHVSVLRVLVCKNVHISATDSYNVHGFISDYIFQFGTTMLYNVMRRRSFFHLS